MITIVAAVSTFLLLFFYRIYSILPPTGTPKMKKDLTGSSDTRSLAIFLGSGGHTSEALALLSTLDFRRYVPRTYLVSEGDTLSSQKAMALEVSMAAVTTSSSKPNGSEFKILTIPRARQVHQPLLTTPASALISLLKCVYYVTGSPLLHPRNSRSVFADVLVLNGPGTCFVLCSAVYVNKFFGLPSPRVIYIESFARVHRLSLSGKLLRPLVDSRVGSLYNGLSFSEIMDVESAKAGSSDNLVSFYPADY